MKKRIVSLALVLILLLGLIPVSAANEYQITVNPISIEVGGQEFLPTDVNGKNVPVFEYGGTTYAPLRALAEAYGLTVGYNAEKNLAYVEGSASTEGFAGTKGTARALTARTTITVQPINIEVGGEVFRPTDANGNAVEVFAYEGTTYAPLRALAEAYGLLVGYDANAKLAFVTDGAVQDLGAFLGDSYNDDAETFGVLIEYAAVMLQKYRFDLVDSYRESYDDGRDYWMLAFNLAGHTPKGDNLSPWKEQPCDFAVAGVHDPSAGYDNEGYVYFSEVFRLVDDGWRYGKLGMTPDTLFGSGDDSGSSGGSGLPGLPSSGGSTGGNTSGTTGGNTGGGTTTPSVPTGGVRVADPIDVSTGNPPMDGTVIPDIVQYADGMLEGDAPELSGSGERSQSAEDTYEFTREQTLEMVEAYVDLLCTEFGFELVDENYEFYKNYQEECYWSYGLNSTKGIGRRTQTLQYKDTKCDVQIWGSGKYNSIDVYLVCGMEFDITDTGHRYGGEKRDMSYAGPSAGAGLIKNADGSYSTDDGRLTAAVGEAHVIRDGVSYKTTAGTATGYTAATGDYYRSEAMYLVVYDDAMYPGDVFSMYDMFGYSYIWNEAYSKGERILSDSEVLVSAAWNGTDYYIPYYLSDETPYEDMTLRFLYEEDGVEVYYAYIEFAYGEPRSVEALIVVDTNMNDESSSSSSSGSSSSSLGGVPSSERTCTWCRGSGEEDCFECDGDGDVSCGFCHGRGETGYGDEEIDCPRCDGMGDEMCDICLGSGTRKCSRCGGDGVD